VHVPAAEDTQDILQETLLGVWKSLISYQSNACFKTWVIAIARRKIADYYRKSYRDKDGETIDLYALRDTLETPQYEDRMVDRLIVKKAIGTLSPLEQELIFLLFQARLSYRDIAAITELPMGTVKSKMHAIKNKLKKQLEEQEGWK